MARRVFFSFHFENDIWRANQVRNSNVVSGADAAGFFDHSEYEEAKRKGDDEIKQLIRAKLNGTSVTVVLIGQETASRPYVQYEIQQSIGRSNGLVGIYIHLLKDRNGYGTMSGPAPILPSNVPFPSFTWYPEDWSSSVQRLASYIESAGKLSDTLNDR
jgi:hypothetical protein